MRTSVASDEVVGSLLGGELSHRGQDAKCIAREKDDILGVRSHTGDHGIGNELNGVGCIIGRTLRRTESDKLI